MMSRQTKLKMIQKVIEKNNLIVSSNELGYDKTCAFSDGEESYIFGDVMRISMQGKNDGPIVSFASNCYYNEYLNSVQFAAWTDMNITEDFIERANAKIDFLRKNFDDAMKIRNEKLKEIRKNEIQHCAEGYEV